MPANINQFISQFRKTELARPCNFDVYIFPSTALLSTIFSPSLIGKIFQSYLLANSEKFTFKCEGSEYPSRSFGLTEQMIYGYTQAYPVSNTYDKTNLTFICSDDMSERKFFDLWMESISTSNPAWVAASSINNFTENTLGIDLGFGARFDFQYKDNYTATIQINQYDLTGKVSYTIELIEAFPFAISPMPLQWQQANEYHRLGVSIAYKYYVVKNLL